MYKVVDQNFLREPNPALHDFLSAGNFAVFPDDAAMEMYKGNAITNLQRSLEIISKYPLQVVILKKTQTVARLTQRGNKQLRRLLIDRKQTASFGAFCGQIYSIDPRRLSPELAQIERMGREAYDFIQKRMESTSLILQAIGGFSKAFPPDEMKELRADSGYSQALYERMLKHILTTTARLMKGHGFFLKDSRLVKDNYLFRFSLAGYLLAMRWVAKGGHSHLPIEKLQNDVDDMTYVAYATYYDGLLSKDRKMNEMYSRTMDFMARS